MESTNIECTTLHIYIYIYILKRKKKVGLKLELESRNTRNISCFAYQIPLHQFFSQEVTFWKYAINENQISKTRKP